jgi:hypothetical protein
MSQPKIKTTPNIFFLLGVFFCEVGSLKEGERNEVKGKSAVGSLKEGKRRKVKVKSAVGVRSRKTEVGSPK